MTEQCVEIEPAVTQNDEPYVTLYFGPLVTPESEARARKMACGYGLSCGYGPGWPSHAAAAAKRLAQRLRRLGWSVSVRVRD